MVPEGSPLIALAQQRAEVANPMVAERSVGNPQYIIFWSLGRRGLSTRTAKNDKSPVRDDTLLTWSDASPHLSIGQDPIDA
jgi:hypothetical protein